jgi:hypothetical protein
MQAHSVPHPMQRTAAIPLAVLSLFSRYKQVPLQTL